MLNTVLSPRSRTEPSPASTPRVLIGLSLLLAGVLPAIGFLILPAIGWPDIAQGMSAGEALPKVAANEVAFRLGFGAMTLGALVALPATIYLARRVGGWFLLGLALAAAVLRPLWYGSSLTVIPVLQDLWERGDASTRAAVDVFYVGYNDLMSTVQEDIGVNIFNGLFLLMIGIGTWKRAVYPRWLAVLAAISGVSFLVSSAELLGLPNPAFIAIAGPVLSSLWFIALGVVELARARREPTVVLA